MNLAELVAEYKGRGFDYHTTAKAEGYINDAYLVDICEEEDWPFLEALHAEEAAPLSIANLRTVEQVIDTTQALKLKPLDPRHITDDYDTDLSTVGSPEFYYLTNGPTLNVYPTSTTSLISVKYWKAPEPLTGIETPLLPTRFHSLIVDGAVARAYEDSDDYELAENAEAKFQRRLQRMREALLVQGRDGPDDYVQLTNSLYSWS